MKKVIGRKKELDILTKILRSKSAELVAIYGRRRVGKTFLVREFFKTQGCYFELSGRKDHSPKEQLTNFVESFSKTFYPELTLSPPKNWKSAFALLTKEFEKIRSKKIILFFDEVPWLASKKSKFMQALDHYWNAYWSQMPNVKVILCGSAASWMLENLIHAKGGLHNRITRTLQLHPFNLRETQEYLKSRGIRLNEKQLLDLYMVMGGIPFYLNYLERGRSAEQNIQEICFSPSGPLLTEFETLFQSLFEKAELNLRIVREIAKKKGGMSREELLDRLKMTSGGTFNRRLNELQAAGFITSFVPHRYKKKEQHFRILDEYTGFYLTWIDPLKDKGFHQSSYWKTCLRSPSWQAWAGLAFESVCYKHIPQMIRALRLDSVPLEIATWRHIPKKGSLDVGAQIDLLFDRHDNAISVCEMKYCAKEYGIDKSYAKELAHKLDCFGQKTKTTKQLFLTLITTFGVKKGLWTDEIANEVVLKDLYAF